MEDLENASHELLDFELFPSSSSQNPKTAVALSIDLYGYRRQFISQITCRPIHF